MNQIRGYARALLVLSILLITATHSVAESRPSPSSDFPSLPTAALEIRRIRDEGDYDAMRAHGWSLLEKFSTVWEQWPVSSDVLADQQVSPKRRRSIGNVFPMSAQSLQESKLLNSETTSQSAAETSLGLTAPATRSSSWVSITPRIRRPAPWVTVHFSPDAAEHIRAKGYATREAFTALLPQSASIETRASFPPVSIAEFPSTTITVKASWRIVPITPAAGEVWILPTWDPETDHNPAAANPPTRWKRSIALDFSDKLNPSDPSIALRLGRKTVDCKVVPVTCFHRRVLSARECDDLGVPPNSQALLVALHLATKELPEWIWATYWWHDLPQRGPFAVGRPSSLTRSPWGNYLMDVDFARPLPTSEADAGEQATSQRPISNPWLEGSFKGGLASNCVSCHQQASVTPDLHATPFTPIPFHPVPENDSRFFGRLRTDFIWSLTVIGDRP